MSTNLKITIGGEVADLPAENFPLSISYKLEDREDLQIKTSTEALSIKIPATTANDKISNTFHNPGVKDLTTTGFYQGFRPAVIEAAGSELLVGKALLKEAVHTNRPISYEYDVFGGNGDWKLPLQDATLYDFLKHIVISFTKTTIVNSWSFDGTNPALPYVFAAARYGQHFETLDEKEDYNLLPIYMRPAISKYFILYWAFKSVGYRIQSTFLDTEYFRRQVMPWTWGNFLDSDGTRLDTLRFIAKSAGTKSFDRQVINQYVDLDVTNDNSNGAYDNSNTYTYVGNAMRWTYPSTTNYGTLEATFHIAVDGNYESRSGSKIIVNVRWFKNGVDLLIGKGLIVSLAPDFDKDKNAGTFHDYETITVGPGDFVEAKIEVYTHETGRGAVYLSLSVSEFSIDRFHIPLGGTIPFDGFTGFQKWKFLDLLRGVIDEFNLAIQTDNLTKTVYIEPTHPYSLVHDLSAAAGGYINGNFIDWTEKQDLSRVSILQNYSDSERELIFKYRDDSADGILKVIQDRSLTTVAAGKYVLPDRFKTGKREVENRFFAPTMHYVVEQWRSLTGFPPQIPVIVPENVSNTSKGEAGNTFAPKSCYYKGTANGLFGYWVFDGDTRSDFPLMFSVNYQTGGHNDPVLSYSDEKTGVGSTAVVAKGLLNRFYRQRMAILRNGRYYDTFFRLNNTDVQNGLHREHIVIEGQKWELVQVNNYLPLQQQSTACFLRQHEPVSLEDANNTYPSVYSVNAGTLNNSFDTKYQPLKCLFSDVK